jgi:hypothetical protein
MPLTRVTITGADDSVTPHSLFTISQAYPFVEWGILSSFARGRFGAPRSPSLTWIKDLQAMASSDGSIVMPPALSLHLCGLWVREFLRGDNCVPAMLFEHFQRVQLNFGGEQHMTEPDPERFAAALVPFGARQLIFQIDGVRGADYLEEVGEWGNIPLDCVPLFDRSHGTGETPSVWPAPYLLSDYPAYGYAGGLGPHNLAEQLPRILDVVGDVDIWIDLETHVRSDNDKRFDLEKVIACLEIAQLFVQKKA